MAKILVQRKTVQSKPVGADNVSLLVDDQNAEPWGPDPAAMAFLANVDPNDTVDVQGGDDAWSEWDGISSAPWEIMQHEPDAFGAFGSTHINGPSDAYLRPLAGPLGVPASNSRGAGLPRDTDIGGMPGAVNANPFEEGAVVAPEDFTLRGKTTKIQRRSYGQYGPVGGGNSRIDTNNAVGQAFQAGLIPDPTTEEVYASMLAGI